MADWLSWGRLATRTRRLARMGRDRLAAAGRWSVRALHRLLMAPVRGTRWLIAESRRAWGRLTHFYRHFIANLVIGLAIAVVLHLYHASPLLHPLDDAAIDWTMRMYRGTEPAEGTRPVAFIDIDDASWRQWGEPLITPREKLAALLRHAIDGDAKAIVLDIDLVYPGGDGDATLRSVLERWLLDAHGLAPDLPPLILVRDLRLSPMGSGSLPEERATSFDALVERAPGIHWGTPLFELDADGKVRRWQLWTATCGVGGTPLVRTSIQLLLAALLDGSAAERSRLQQVLGGFVPADCGTALAETGRGERDQHGKPVHDHGEDHADTRHDDHQGHDEVAITLGNREIHLRPHATAARVVYREPWHPEPGRARHETQLDGRGVPVISVRPAAAVAETTDPRSSEWLRGHIAIIGGSHPETRDIHMTPIGWMPGALILANAVHSLGHHGELRMPSLGMTLALETFLIIVMSAFFAKFSSLPGSLLSGLAVLFVLLPVSLLLFRYGTWLSFAIPLIAIFVHKLIAEIEESIGKLQKIGDHHD